MTLTLFQWFETTAIGYYGRHSSYFFPAVEVIHLLGLTMLLGTVLLIDLRLLNAVMRRQSVAAIAHSTRFLLGGGVAATVTSGALLFLTEAVKCYYNPAFWWKMTLLSCAVMFQFIAHRTLRRPVPPSARAARATASTSLLLWFGVAIAGRAIAFV